MTVRSCVSISACGLQVTPAACGYKSKRAFWSSIKAHSKNVWSSSLCSSDTLPCHSTWSNISLWILGPSDRSCKHPPCFCVECIDFCIRLSNRIVSCEGAEEACIPQWVYVIRRHWVYKLKQNKGLDQKKKERFVCFDKVHFNIVIFWHYSYKQKRHIWSVFFLLLVFIKSCCKSLILAVYILKCWRICRQWMYWSCLICNCSHIYYTWVHKKAKYDLCFQKTSVKLQYTYFVSYNCTSWNQFILGSTISVFQPMGYSF